VELFDGRMDGWMDGQMNGQTDIIRLTVALHNFANKPKNQMSQDICCKVRNCHKKLQCRNY
jgi:hypothetical protein